jgi:CRISPR-associated endonuclease Csn1
VRCKVAAGRGYLTPEKALEIHEHDSKSKHQYKRYVYAQNDSNTYCLYYELINEDKVERAFRIVGLFELAKVGLKSEMDLYKDAYYNNIEVGKGKKKQVASLSSIIKVGVKVIFYKESVDELKELSIELLLKRVFKVYKFNETGSPLIYLQNHLEARSNDNLSEGDTSFDEKKYQHRLKLVASGFKCAIEHQDFEVKLDGQIVWL